MFAIKYCCDLSGREYDYKIFETVGKAFQWWLDHIGPGGTKFYDMLYVLPPKVDDPIKWCKDNIKEVASA